MSETSRTRSVNIAKRAVPIAVSVAVLAWIIAGVDHEALLGLLTPRVAWVLSPALLLYAAVTLVLEARALHMVVPDPPPEFDAWAAARIKCASYLLGIVNFALGAGALVLLLTRQTRLSLAEAAGRVLLISITDLLVLFAAVTLGGSLIPQLPASVRLGLLAAALAGIGGFALLRWQRPLGPLDALRNLPVIRELRVVPLDVLLRLAPLRMLFVTSFPLLCWSAFTAFRIDAPMPLILAGMLVVGVIGALPIAIAGLGTTQLAVMEIFAGYAPPETLLAMSLVLTTGLLIVRGAMGAVFARELTREAWRERESVAT